jgi:aminoglycoside 6-adenylyltransferase
MTYEDLQNRLAAWAATQPSIRAVIITGSRARGAQDRYSDLDCVILTTERERYAADPEWLRALGTLRLWYVDVTGAADPEWYALYEGGLKLDAALLVVEDVPLDLESLLLFYPYQDVFARGINIIYDQQGEPRVIPPQPRQAPEPPSEGEYERVIRGFLLASTSTAKFIARGDLWRAQTWFSHNLRRYLLRMIEWDASADGRDTWYSGRNIERWAGADVAAGLPQVYAQYDRDSLQNALLAIVPMFRRIAEEVGARLGYRYPAEMHDWIAAMVDSLLREQA